MSVDIQTILVATDFSTASEAATTYAFQLARALGVRVILLHVVPESDVAAMVALHGHLQSHISREALIHTFSTEAEKQLAALVDEFLNFATPHPLEIQPHDLREIARQAVASLPATRKHSIVGACRPGNDVARHGLVHGADAQ